MRPEGFIEKGWGHEFIFATNDKYCGKILKFNKDAMCSMHFHNEKDETLYILSGEFIVKHINTDTAEITETVLTTGDTWRNMPLFPHQIICTEEGVIVEVSSPDSVEDNYRLLPGNSQV
jgi:mannose-6-phosphate isomerase-like protein (cupin superfamily)